MTEKPVAIVTGVGPGTGAAIVKRFSAGGFRTIALARSTELINRLSQGLPDVHAGTCDVSDESQVGTVVTYVKRRFGAVEVLIHNVIDTPRMRARMSDRRDEFFIKPAAIAEELFHLYGQDRSAWSFLTELRPFRENW